MCTVVCFGFLVFSQVYTISFTYIAGTRDYYWAGLIVKIHCLRGYAGAHYFFRASELTSHALFFSC